MHRPPTSAAYSAEEDPYISDAHTLFSPDNRASLAFADTFPSDAPKTIAMNELYSFGAADLDQFYYGKMRDYCTSPDGEDLTCSGREHEHLYAASTVDSSLVRGFSPSRYTTVQASAPLEEGSLSDTHMTTESKKVSSQPYYADLIYRALVLVPDRTMSLSDLYEWFEHRTDKTNNRAARVWQNSIRHNLSRNPAFEKVSRPSNGRYAWRLREGVQERDIRKQRHPKTQEDRRRCKAATVRKQCSIDSSYGT